MCIECADLKQKEWREKNAGRVRELDRQRQERDKEKRLAKGREYKRRERQRLLAYNREWRKSNPELASNHSKRWHQKNPDAGAARCRARQAALLQRMPQWADRDAIREFYTEAIALTVVTGTAHHVDHIIPLQGRLVSGLHVEGNLQVLSAEDNLRKANLFGPR